jgi:peroxiredoxin
LTKRSKVYPAQIPPLPLRPGRGPLSKRTRLVFVVALAAVIVGIAVGGALLALLSKGGPGRFVTIPAADRGASPALVRAAQAVGFHPLAASGIGRVESQPAALAGPPSADGLLALGAAAPPFALPTPTGETVSLRSLRGKAVLLEFFATWCPHCGAEAPHLRRLYGTLPHARAAVVSIDGNGGDAASVFAWHVYFGLPFPALLDHGARTATFPAHGDPGPVTRSYGVSAYPTFYVLDGRGRVTWRSSGEQPDALLALELRRAVAAG